MNKTRYLAQKYMSIPCSLVVETTFSSEMTDFTYITKLLETLFCKDEPSKSTDERNLDKTKKASCVLTNQNLENNKNVRNKEKRPIH